MEECKHCYKLLEDSNMGDGNTGCWVFYCEHCLDIVMKTKVISMNKVDPEA